VTQPPEPIPIDLLIAETRAMRQALHELIDRLRQDRLSWRQTAEAFACRPRLTRDQRRNFERHVLKGGTRRGP
jgi:hypothetical protein